MSLASQLIIITVFLLLAMSPLAIAFFGSKKNYGAKKIKRNIILNLVLFGTLCILAFALPLGAAAAGEPEAAETAAGAVNGLGLIAAALATGMSSLGAGLAVGPAAVSAIGAISESSEMMGKSIIFVALAEGVAIYGMLISILILNKI